MNILIFGAVPHKDRNVAAPGPVQKGEGWDVWGHGAQALGGSSLASERKASPKGLPAEPCTATYAATGLSGGREGGRRLSLSSRLGEGLLGVC